MVRKTEKIFLGGRRAPPILSGGGLTLGVTLLSDVDAMIDRGVHDDRRLGIEIPGRMGEGRDASSDGRVLTGKECWLHLQNLGSKHKS